MARGEGEPRAGAPVPALESRAVASTAFARRVFFWAGIYGILALAPLYLMERELGRVAPPPLNHPEHFYGFLGVALAWQLAFLLISRDVVRYRPLMLVAVAEKLLFGPVVFLLWAQGRVAPLALAPAAVDLILAVLFAVSYRLVGRAARRGSPEP